MIKQCIYVLQWRTYVETSKKRFCGRDISGWFRAAIECLAKNLTIPQFSESAPVNSGDCRAMNPDAADGPQPVKPPPQRRKFTPEEDLILRTLVEKLGTSRWNEIAQFLPRRTSRQCRDRYMNYLMDSIVRNPWTREEDAILIRQVHEIGPRWVQIGKMLRGRSATNVKNRWYKRLRKIDANMPPPADPTLPLREPFEQNEQKPILNLSQILGITDSDWPQMLTPENSGTGPPSGEATIWNVGNG
jgi:hypothetical protein